MEKKYFDDFLKVFSHIKYAALIISGDFYKPRLKQEIEEIEKIVNQLDDSNSTLFKNILDEIEQNLHSPSVSNEPYLIRILRAFVDIAPYLTIAVVEGTCIEFGKQMVIIGGRTYPNSLTILHKTLIFHEAWRNHVWDEVITIPEKYAIICFRAFQGFLNHLDAVSLDFNIDLMEIQSRNELHIWERDTSTLTRLGYSSEYFKNVKNKYELTESIPFQIKESKKQELPEKIISFKSPETIDRLFEELKGYFPERGIELKKALDGERLDELLLFPHNGNKFVEVFKRAKYNGYVLSTSTEIKTWICSNFKYRYVKGGKIEPKPFIDSTVWDILTKDKGPTKNERICMTDWLPYKSHLQRKREAEQEQL